MAAMVGAGRKEIRPALLDCPFLERIGMGRPAGTFGTSDTEGAGYEALDLIGGDVRQRGALARRGFARLHCEANHTKTSMGRV
jgi:hypothetical protein